MRYNRRTVKLERGSQLGPYEVVGPIGAGGMGEVWRARDTRLSRDVAIKILPAEFAASAQLHARLDREAQAISQLEHAHICRLYDIGEAILENGGATSPSIAGPPQPQRYLVMEFLEGESLADLLLKGPLAPGEVLRYGQQIASALDAAHRKGIIHRDLKPGNVMITRSGAKLLDFGLAKAAYGSSSGAQHEDPTEQKPLTEEGIVVGTIQYMAPEQLEGIGVDARTDIFALGSVLYEMATGRRAFSGTSRTRLMASIVTSEPEPIARLQPAAPLALDFIVRKCLQKHPDDRWQSARDVAGQLQWVAEVSSSQRVEPLLIERARPWQKLTLSLGMLLALGIAAAAGWQAQRQIAQKPSPAAGIVRSQIALPPGVRLHGWGPPSVAISPDGRYLAYVGTETGGPRLYIRRLDRDEATMVIGSESAEGPFFSPDSRYVGFAVSVSLGADVHPPELRVVSVDGGLPKTVCALKDFFGGTWAADGNIYFVDGAGEGLWRVAAAGGEPELVTRNDLVVFFPSAVRDENSVLASVVGGALSPEIVVIDTVSGEVRGLGLEGSGPVHLPTGHLVYGSIDRQLIAVPFDPATGSLRGRGVPLLGDLAITGGDMPVFAASSNGTLVYAQGYVRGSGRELNRLIRVGRDGTATPLPFEPDTYSRRGLSISPDGGRVATTTWDGKLWIADLKRQARFALPQANGTFRDMPLWTVDGKALVFTAQGAGLDSLHLFIQAADGTSAARQLTAGFDRPFETWATSWAAPDILVFNHLGPRSRGISSLDISSERPAARPLLDQEGMQMRYMHGRVSPDGRWLLHNIRQGDQQALHVRRSDLAGGPIAVAPVGTEGRWSADGREIYFRRGDQLMAVDFSVERGEAHPGVPRPLFELPGLRTYQPIPGGREFIALVEEKDAGVQTTLSIVQNWFSEIQGVSDRKPSR
jgi:eukaryotic-like serine/threonine-protein kinase